ncbi:TPA: tail fiber protein [Providencia rettgeri]|nr:tail fiber protein [Providencia rettgeri]
MQDLMPPINTPDSAFHDGDPTTGQLGTIVTALWLNNVQSATRDVQLEIKNVLAKAGIQPDPKKTNQLAEAISQIIGSGNYASTAYVNNGLNKKIDKASISGQKGNDNDKVPSLNLFTTEIGKLAALGYSYSKIESDGKYQPKGDYAPAGNSYSKAESDAKYPTVTVLNSGLGLKIDKTSIVQSTGTSTTQVMSQDAVTKSFMKPGDFGFGSIGSGVMLQNTEVLEEYRTNAIGYAYGGSGKTYKNGNHSFLNVFGHFSGNYGVQIAAPISSKNDIGFRIISNNNVLNWAELYHTDNTSTDRNGYLRKAGTTEEMQGVPIGASILWNTSAQIPANFWPNEGRSFSSSEYPDLAKVYPSLKLPDDRGYAIRIADNGRGVDAGRIVGTYQDCAIENITGKFGAFKAVSGAAIEGGAFKAIGETGASHEAKEPGVSTFDFDASRVVRTANETRMKNVAKILITRMK